MRIIATRRDYYDGVQRNQMFSEDDVVYIRKPQVITKDVDESFTLPASIKKLFNDVYTIMCRYDLYCNQHNCGYLIDLSVVGFCNKIYPVILLKTVTEESYKTTWCCFSSIKECMNSDYYQTLLKKLPRSVRHFDSNIKSVTDTCTRNMMLVENDKSLLTLFEKYNTPIFQFANDFGFTSLTFNERYRCEKLLINPLLKEINFQAIVDPFTAFQELSMYLSNQARPNKPMVAISNNAKIVKAGYDLKTSFRKCKAQKV